MNIKCKICGQNSTLFDSALILKKYHIKYYYCPNCGFLQTEEPYWLDEAYSKAIAAADTGIIVRNLRNANNLLFFMKHFSKQGGVLCPCLDFGGGHGILTRLMRDYGFDFYNYDKYADNLFAEGFCADLNKKYLLCTSFENFEHFVNPLEEIKLMVNLSNTIYFQTLLLPANPVPRINEWWYYVPATGQHISFYSIRTLQNLAKKFGLQLLSDGFDQHIFSKNPIEKSFFKKLRFFNKIRNELDIANKYKHESKTWNDFLLIRSANKDKKQW